MFGGGFEYAIDPRWSWKLEYLYSPFDRSYDTAIIRSWDASFNVVRAGLNYRFGDGGAPAGAIPLKAAASRSSWSGGYLGLHGGYGWGKLDEIFTNSFGTVSLKPDGGYGGLQGGYNWLFAPQSLLGIGADASFGDLKDSGVFSGLRVPVKAKIENLGTARLRLGYLVTPDTLLYATGGAAYAREKFSFLPIDAKVDHAGWTVGGGVEWKFAPEWSVKAEYLYADLGTFKANAPVDPIVPIGAPPSSIPRTSDLTLNTVRVGLNYSGLVIERFFGGR